MNKKKFEGDFPGLKGKEKAEFDIARDRISLRFVQLEDNCKKLYGEKDIQEHCLDKERVRDAIEKFSNIEFNDKESEMDRWEKTVKGLKELKKELGLDE